MDGTIYYLSSRSCLFAWDQKTNAWFFQSNYYEDVKLVYKLRGAFYLKSHLYSFDMPSPELLAQTKYMFENLKNSISKDHSQNLASNLHLHLATMCPLLNDFLNSRFAYYQNDAVQKNVVNYLINLVYLLHQKSISFHENSSNVPQKIFAFVGPGQSGKSTFTNFIGNVVADGSVKTTSTSVLNGDSRFETFYWLGKAAIIIPEVEPLDNSHFWSRSLGFIKSVSGHDLIPWEVKFGSKGQSRISGVLILTSNHPLNASTKSEYISQYRRFVNIFFAESVRKDDALSDYSEKLGKEAIPFIIFCNYLRSFEEID
jgi:phage/plasmid-associated DNA primase